MAVGTHLLLRLVRDARPLQQHVHQFRVVLVAGLRSYPGFLLGHLSYQLWRVVRRSNTPKRG